MEPTADRWDGAERRKSPRLRKVIDDLQAAVRENRDAIAAMSREIFSLKEHLDIWRKST